MDCDMAGNAVSPEKKKKSVYTVGILHIVYHKFAYGRLLVNCISGSTYLL